MSCGTGFNRESIDESDFFMRINFVFCSAFAILFLNPNADALTISCPRGQKVAWGITTSIPKNAANLKEQSITPSTYGTPSDWDINSVSGTSGRRLYLSCAYANKKIFSKSVPYQENKCITKDYSKDLRVECTKR